MPKISVVTIVLNGMPFLKYSLEAMLPFVDEIIIVEGAVPNCMFAANEDGTSKDGTTEYLSHFSYRNNVTYMQTKLSSKLEMQNKALEYVTGDYVWLVDSDEVYCRKDIIKITELLDNDDTITQVNFIPSNFWKGFNYIFECPEFFTFPYHYRRLFKFKPGSIFITHRPPTMVWPEQTNLSTESINLLGGNEVRELGISLLHYSYVLLEQVKQKQEFYGRMASHEIEGVNRRTWTKECFEKWTPENREEIENEYSLWMGNKHTKSKLFMGTHPDVMLDFIRGF